MVKDPYKSAEKQKEKTQIPTAKPVKKNGTKQSLKTWLSKQPPCLSIGTKKYIFNNIVIKHIGDCYGLVLPCDETTWVFRKTKDGQILVCALQNRKGVGIQKDSPLFGVYIFFLDLTRGIPFSSLLEIAEKIGYPSRVALEYEEYLLRNAKYLKTKAHIAAKNAAKENAEQ